MISVEALVKILLLIVLNVCIFSVIMYLLALFVRSSSAWSGMGTVAGTLAGFAGAIYLPMGCLPDGVAAVLKYIPILHGASLLRGVCCESALARTFENPPAQAPLEYKEYMGIQVKMGQRLVYPAFQVLFLAGCGILAFIIIVAVQKRRGKGDIPIRNVNAYHIVLCLYQFGGIGAWFSV